MSTTPCCACPDATFPPEPDIPAGLDRLPRQGLGFPEYRSALLSGIRRHVPLLDWRAREGDDLGLMLLESAAYVLDVVGFYDQEIAQNFYVRTAGDLGALRRLVDLLGYRPRPAIAARALLAAIADRGPAVLVPAGTAFRSEAFGDEPPQIFEVDHDTTIAPARNRWRVAPIRPTTAEAGAALLFEVASLKLVRGAWCILMLAPAAVGRVADVRAIRAVDGAAYAEVTLAPPVTIPPGTALGSLQVLMPTARASLNRLAETPATATTLVLDAVYPQLAAGQAVLLVTSGTNPAAAVVTLTEAKVVSVTPTSSLPTLPATQITFPAPGAAFPPADGDVTVHFLMVDGGRLVRPAATRIRRSDLGTTVPLNGPSEPLDEPARGPLLLLDRDGAGAEIEGTVSVAADGRGLLRPGALEEPFPAFAPPLDVHGNVIAVTRGQSVAHEVLGSGDVTVELPSFQLKKKPLTYVRSAKGPASTLEIRVNGIRWTEVESFYGTTPGQEVFIVRQDEEQNSHVTFWRVPTGIDNIVARYRFGAGAAVPPAGGITQIVRPVKGLVRIVAPLAAGAGRDADRPDEIRRNGPASALTLGRAVSLADFEALARAYGVVNATADWAWDPGRQRALVKVWFISDAGDVSDDLRVHLADQADPSVPLVASPAVPDPRRLVVDVVVDARFTAADVERDLIAALTDAHTGLLAHANVPIGGTLFRSELFAAVSAVPGVSGINGMTVDGAPAPSALTAGEGRYLDFLPFTNR